LIFFNNNLDKDYKEFTASKKSNNFNQTKYFDEVNNLSNDNLALNKYLDNQDNSYMKKLQKKLIKQEIELNYFKDKNKKYDNNKKVSISFEDEKNREFSDLLMHIHNQAKIIENIIEI